MLHGEEENLLLVERVMHSAPVDGVDFDGHLQLIGWHRTRLWHRFFRRRARKGEGACGSGLAAAVRCVAAAVNVARGGVAGAAAANAAPGASGRDASGSACSVNAHKHIHYSSYIATGSRPEANRVSATARLTWKE